MAENYSIVTDVNAGNSLAVLDQIVNKVMQVESAIGKASGQKLQIDAPGANNMLSGWTSQLSGSKGNFANVGKELGQSLTMGMQQQFGMAGGVATSLAGALGGVGIAAVAGVAGLTALGAASVNAARGWESLMAGVSKTTGAEGAALTQLSNTLLNLSREMPIAQAEIAKIATVGGTLGVKQSDLPKFVKDTAMASAGWGMSGEEAANSIAGISNAFKVPIADAQKFGSVINTMADNVGGSEKELADFLVRASGIATTFNEGIASTTAFGAVLASINMPMEVAATGLQSMMSFAMADPKRMSLWADTMGISVEQLNTKLQDDLYGTLIESSNKVATTGSETDQLALRMKLWGEGGARVSSGLVGMQNKYTEALKSANEQLKTGSSLAQAFGAQGATVDAKWQKFTNTMTTALIHLGTAALPVLGQVLDTMSGLIAKADEFAATTLPAWAQGATDWVNETLGMTEDTPEQIAERKAKIARTAEKTATKVADTTGYQSYAEAQASAANLGQGTGNSYVDGLNAALDTGVPKALTDAYLGDALSLAKGAAAKAGGLTGEEWVKAYGSAASAGMTMVNGKWVSNTERDSFYKDKSLDYGKYSTFANGEVAWNLLKESASGKSKTLVAKIAVDGTEYTREFSTMEDTAESATRKIKAEFRDVALDIPKYFKTVGDDVSNVLENALTDGVISFTEKDELKNYLKSLETLETTYPIQFEASHLDDLKSKIEDAVAGTLITFDASEISLNFSRFISENAEMYNKIYQKTGVISYESNEKLLHDALVKAPQEAQDLFAELQSAISSGDFQSLQMIPSIIQEIGDVAPELLVLKGTTDRLNTAQEEWEDNYRNLGKTTAEASENGDKMDGTFIRTSQNADIVSRGFTGMASAEYEQARAVKAAKSGMEMLYSPIITTKDGLKTLDKPLTDLSTTGNALDAAFVDTTVCVGNANTALSSFAEALNSAAGRISSLSTYESRSYAPTVAGTAYTSLNTYAAQSARAYDPLEMILAYNKNLPKFAKGGISLTKGLAQVDANELHIPADQLPCAVSSLYDVLENPNLFFPTGLGTITDSTGATYPTQAKLESFGQTIDTANLSLESANSGILKLSSGATYVSDRWMDEYDRFTITAPGTGFQSSSKRGYVPVSISEAAKENIIYNPFTDESNWQAAGMDAKIFAMRQQYAGKSSVMPTGANTNPDWIVEASNGIIPKYSEGVLNSLAVEYDSLQAVNTEKVRYADLQGTELRNILMQSDAIIDATAAGGEYCEAMSQFGIVTEEAARTAERNGMFQKAYIGPSKYYEQAKEYFAGNDVVDAIGKTTEKVSDVEDAVDDSANEYGKYGRALDALADGIFSGFKSLSGTGALIQPGKLSQTSKWYMDEFYTIEYGLGQCVSYLSDFAIMQEGVFSDVLFKPSYIGKTEGYAGAGKGGLPGYSNIAEILPQNALEMQEAASRFADIADMTDANYQLSKIGETSKATQDAVTESAKANSATAKNTQEMSADMKASMTGMGYSSTGQLVAANGGARGWGGTSIGGGGGWIGTSGSYTGMNGSVYYGSTVGGIGAVASQQARSGGYSIGSFSAGNAIQYAEGGITDHPVFGVFGEAGREAFVPISDRSAGLRILPQVMRELGVRTFATGGIVGSGGLSTIMESIGGTSIGQITVINHANEPVNEEKLAKKILEQVAKKTVLSARRRG